MNKKPTDQPAMQDELVSNSWPLASNEGYPIGLLA